MIKPGEIQQKAREIGVRDQQIEKDYMLSWILRGIADNENLSKIIAFKGGTVLKKIYFDKCLTEQKKYLENFVILQKFYGGNNMKHNNKENIRNNIRANLS